MFTPNDYAGTRSLDVHRRSKSVIHYHPVPEQRFLTRRRIEQYLQPQRWYSDSTILSHNNLHLNAQSMGAPPRPPLHLLCNPPISLHPYITSPSNPTLRPGPIRFRQPLTILSCTLHHGIRRPQSCRRAGYAGVLLAGHA